VWKKRVIKINPSAFKFIAELDIFMCSFAKDIELFPEDAGGEELDARTFEFATDYPYCSPYAISAGDMTPRRFEYKGRFIQFSPSPNGLPTIRDFDVLIYCSTWIANAALDGRDGDVGSTYEFEVEDFYAFAGRQRGGDRENAFIQGLERLAGSTVTTNTRPIGLENYAFNYIEKFETVRDDAGNLKSVIIKVPHTFYCMAHNEFFDKIHADYFTLPPVRRLIYLFLKQYRFEKLSLSFAKLHAVTGATSPLRKFMPAIQDLVDKQLPEFTVEKDKGREALSFAMADHGR